MTDGRQWAAQSQLILPLLDALASDGGGAVTAREAYSAVAHRVGVDDEGRAQTISCGSYRRFDRDVRWARQKAVALGLVSTPERGQWQITGKGRSMLREARPGVVITIFETDAGVALWGACEDACGIIEKGSVQLVLTSPPYPLLREKQYGNMPERDHIEWLTSCVAQWAELLTPDGSIVLNLGDTWLPGKPAQSLYAERLLVRLVDELGLNLCQRFEWYSPNRLPAPAEWVTVRRVRVKPALERVYWLSPHDHPYADNRAVLQPYSSSMRSRISEGGERGALRPSGHDLKRGAFSADNGGAIPPNLLTIPTGESNSTYIRACKQWGLPVHPARFPGGLPDFFIRMLTRKGDTVYDPCSGSGQTAERCEDLGRHWVSSERVLEYAMGHALRFGRPIGHLLAA